MKKNIAKYLVFGLTGVALVTFTSYKMNAAAIANEQPLAGITLSLDKYYEMVADSTSAKTLSIMSTNSKALLVNTGDNTEEVTTTTEDTTEASEENSEAVDDIINLNYDRLGISNVDSYLNIRKKPGEDEKIIGKLPKYAGCNVYSIKDGWAKIKSGKVTGYVKAEFLVLDEEAEKMALEVGTEVATVNTTTLKVRALPSLDSRVYSLVPVDEEMDVLNENISKESIEKFIEKYSEEDKTLLDGVNMDAMMADLGNWVCISIDNESAFVAKEFVDISYKLERAVFIDDVSGDGSSDGSGGSSSVRSQMVQFAYQYLGNRYVYGGTSLTGGIDCSGFMMRIYEHFGYSIPRTSGAQAGYSRSISGSDVRPGDLFFYGNGSSVSHVAMYIGNGQVIHASNARTGIKISNAYYRSPIKIGRIIND
jgi:hypothetical protein